MDERGTGGGGESAGGKFSTSYEESAGRQRFTVKLTPGETTIVSWKKLLKDATGSHSRRNAVSDPAPSSSAAAAANQPLNPSLDSRIAPEVKDAPPGNRLNAVIEKIERLYVGKHSDDEEDLSDVPDEDEYDTEDSFIDDTELDEYFEVDNSAIKHDGFFVNRGNLERIEPTSLQIQLPEKRRRKDQAKGHSGSDGFIPNKLAKVAKDTGKPVPDVAGASGLPYSGVMLDLYHENDSPNITNGQSLLGGEKSVGHDERLNTGPPEAKSSIQPVRREASSVRRKGTVLEKAIRDLEKIVAESRPPNTDVQEADNSSQAIKRRLPLEIKHKLAKVARLAQASHGKVSNELVNRLMSIVGHLMQLRTLKRNLKTMINMGLSAKQEKDDRVQQIKGEVADMIRTRFPLAKSKTIEQEDRTLEDFQDVTTEKKAFIKKRYRMDNALEDKICDLYDLYIEGLEEDAGPQVRKLYSELATYWPNRIIDNHGIKRAICRAKDRKKALYNRRKEEREKIGRNKVLGSKVEVPSGVEAPILATPVHSRERSAVDARDDVPTSANKPVPNTEAVNVNANANAGVPMAERVKGSSSSCSDMRATDALPKKKAKRKPESELNEEGQQRPEKMSSSTQAENKCQKPLAAHVKTTTFQPVAPPSFGPLIS